MRRIVAGIFLGALCMTINLLLWKRVAMSRPSGTRIKLDGVRNWKSEEWDPAFTLPLSVS